MDCVIEWNSLNIAEWQQRFSSIKRSNVLQTYAYARSQRLASGQKSRFGLIKIGEQEAGLVTILEAGILWNAFHAVILDRGPLWFDGFGGAAHIKLFFEEFNRQFPRRFGRKRRIIPEVEDGPAVQALLSQAGLERLPRKGYETIWLDLKADDEILLAGMKKNWRGALNKVQRAGLTIEVDDQGRFLPWLLTHYQLDKEEKRYDGASPQLLQKIAGFMHHDKDCLILRALKDKEAIAGIMIFCHGKSATYQVGWSGAKGRAAGAHHLLLWQALNVLKQRGIEDFDLGGFNEDTAKGVKQFKQGLGGQAICLVGHYI